MDETILITEKKRTIWCPQCDGDITYPSKCNTKGTTCDEIEDTCAIVHKYLGMSVKNVYINRRNHKHQNYPLK